jgi:hypothetical protein
MGHYEVSHEYGDELIFTIRTHRLQEPLAWEA